MASIYQQSIPTVVSSVRIKDYLINEQPELIRRNGYICEVHRHISNDGYILELHRIPRGKSDADKSRPAVYVQHGLLCSSADWIMSGPEKGLAYVLADAGYDVWLGNVRGNRYCRKHISLDPDKDAKKFWNFSWHEIALDDIPSNIDYALNYTKQSKIFYIGHSQGTTVFFVLCSEKPEYNNKIKAFFGLAPVAWMSNAKSPFLKKLGKPNVVEPISKLIGFYEFTPTNTFIAEFEKLMCTDKSVMKPICKNVVYMFFGYSKNQLNTTVLLLGIEHYPAGAASKQVMHYAQEYKSGHFRRWDYGRRGNLKRYGTVHPPDYKVENIVAPAYFYCSTNDNLSSDIDVKYLYSKIKNPKELRVISEIQFNHLDFITGKDAYNLIYKEILKHMASLK